MSATINKPRQLDRELQKALGDITSAFNALSGKISGIKLSEMQRRNPGKFELLCKLLDARFSPALSRLILENMPANETHCMKWAQNVIAHNLRVADENIIEKGGVYALTGVTGVGKTTTAVKLAAHAVMRHGAGKVALLSTDNYRVGAYDHLRIYAKMLSIPVYSMKTREELHQLLGLLENKHLVLIDTPGMCQADQRVLQHAQLLDDAKVKNLLLLNATSNLQILNDVVHAYRNDRTSGCILTKIDEATNLGTSLDVAIRHKLAVHFVTNGQKVPEDLHLPRKDYLLHRALARHLKPGAFSLQDDDYRAMMVPTPAKTPRLSGQVPA